MITGSFRLTSVGQQVNHGGRCRREVHARVSPERVMNACLLPGSLTYSTPQTHVVWQRSDGDGASGSSNQKKDRAIRRSQRHSHIHVIFYQFLRKCCRTPPYWITRYSRLELFLVPMEYKVARVFFLNSFIKLTQ